MHIGTSSYPFSSSTVPATGSFGWQYNASNRVVFHGQVGTESYRRIAFKLPLGRRRIGARLVYSGSSTVPAAGVVF